jgi:hypothetical protein
MLIIFQLLNKFIVFLLILNVNYLIGFEVLIAVATKSSVFSHITRSLLCLLPAPCLFLACLAYSSTLKLKTAYYSEASIYF